MEYMLSTRLSIPALSVLLLLGSLDGFTQAGQQNWVTISASGGFQSAVSVFDKNGQAFVNPGEDVAGSPYFLPRWTSGAVLLHDSTGYTGILLKLDLMRQEIHYQDRNRVEMVLPKGLIREVILRDSASPKGPLDYFFRCGFPPVDNQDANSFYRVLVSGRVMLLESVRKVLVVERNAVAGEEKKEVREYDDYYLFAGGLLQRLKKDKSFIENLLADKKDKIDAFITENKLKLRSADEIQKVIEFYNTL
jgi:hypothetical protein